MRLALLVLAATLVVAAGTACGGDGDEPAAETATSTDPSAQRPEPPPDQSRWAQEVDDACREWQQQIDALPVPQDAESLEAWVEEALPLLRRQIEDVGQVEPSSKDEEANRARLFLDGLAGVERSLTRYLNALRRGDADAMENALAGATEAGSRTRSYAVSLDVTQCGGYEGG